MKSSSGLVLPGGMNMASCLISMVSVFTSTYPLEPHSTTPKHHAYLVCCPKCSGELVGNIHCATKQHT